MERELQDQPAKRIRLRGEERRTLILYRAKSVFARYSYAEASTGELARAAEITEPMLYKHFGSKKGLFLAVLCEFGQQFLDQLQERISHRAELDVFDALTHIVHDYRATINADPEIQRILFQAVIESSDPDIAQSVSKHNRKIYTFLLQLVEHALETGCLDSTISPDAVTWGYMSMILAIQYSLMLNLSSELMPFQEEMNHIWLRGLHLHEG